MRPINVILTLETLLNTSTGPLTRDGADLSQNDTNTTKEVYLQWLLLLVDLGYLSHDTVLRDARRLWDDITSRDVMSINNGFSELSEFVKIQKINGFKAHCAKISNHLFNIFKGDYCAMLDGDVFAAKRLLQATTYTSRLSLIDLDLTEKCLNDYIATEESIDPSMYPHAYIDGINSVIRRWMKSFDPDRLRPGHGPGGVAGLGRTSLYNKYRGLTSDTLLNYAFPDSSNSSYEIRSNLDRISQTIFVPKSYKTFRTISMEPPTLMYYQQGVWKEIDRVVRSSRKLKSIIDFHDQERNQKLAAEGSLLRNYATIDLSAASDSVSYDLVKRVFRGTKLLRYLVATRSPRTLLPDGRLVNLKKFAPMGSALCFPIETIIFAAIAYFVTREHGLRWRFSIFGDDIIVPSQCAQDVVHVLTCLGFCVNQDKSFTDTDCWYRESCGGEYCDGFDVTPMRVSRNFNHSIDGERFQALVSMANTAYEKQFRTLRLFFLRKIESMGMDVLFSSTSVLSESYSNFHVQRRWNIGLQRIECRTHSLVTRSNPGPCEELRYRHWLESTAERKSLGDGFQSNIGRSSVDLKVRWQRKDYEPNDDGFISYFTSDEGNLPPRS